MTDQLDLFSGSTIGRPCPIVVDGTTWTGVYVGTCPDCGAEHRSHTDDDHETAPDVPLDHLPLHVVKCSCGTVVECWQQTR